MKNSFKALLGVSMLSLWSGGAAFAQSSKPAEIKLSPAAKEILCKRFPLNSRCPGGSTSNMAAPSMMPSSSPAMAPSATSMQTIPMVAAESGFKTLTAALKAAGLVTVLEGTGPFTVFAPTDAAFAALPAGTVEMLLKPENKAKLIKVLTYHVLPTKAVSSGLTSMSATTVEGSPVKVTVGSSVMVDEATVTKADIMAKNGVIHVIDKVLLPPDL